MKSVNTSYTLQEFNLRKWNLCNKTPLFEILGKDTHKENVRSRLSKDNTAVQSIITLLNEWECNPFEHSQQLRKLQSGEIANEELVKDLESASKDGDNVVQKYFKERLFSDTKSIYDKIPRNKRKTFANYKDLQQKRFDIAKSFFLSSIFNPRFSL